MLTTTVKINRNDETAGVSYLVSQNGSNEYRLDIERYSESAGHVDTLSIMGFTKIQLRALADTINEAIESEVE